jgi:lipid A 3-O-deacylase
MTHRTPAGPLPLLCYSIALFVTLLQPGFAPQCAAESATLSAGAPLTADAGTGRVAVPAAPENPAKEKPLPDQYGMSVEYGYTYDPHEDISFVLARVFAIYDYGTIWHTERTEAVRFKVEAAAGSTLTPAADLILSANMLALCYPFQLHGPVLRPYVEGGIGVIYTQYRVDGQGLHLNFNPLLGVGCEMPQKDGKNPFVAIRAHHISNGGIYYNKNRGANSVELQIGRYF